MTLNDRARISSAAVETRQWTLRGHQPAPVPRLGKDVGDSGPGEGDLDVGMPVDGERLPRLVLERTDHRVGAGDQDENLRLLLVQQAPRHHRVGRISDLGPDVRAGGGQLGECRASPGDRDHRSTSLGEPASDPTPQAPARPTPTVVLPDKSLTIVLFLCVSMFPVTGCRTRRGGATSGRSRCDRVGRGRATGTCPRGRRAHARTPSRCGRRRHPRA